MEAMSVVSRDDVQISDRDSASFLVGRAAQSCTFRGRGWKIGGARGDLAGAKPMSGDPRSIHCINLRSDERF